MRLHSSPSSTPRQTVRILIADRNRMGTQLLAESLGRDDRFEIISELDYSYSCSPHCVDINVRTRESLRID